MGILGLIYGAVAHWSLSLRRLIFALKCNLIHLTPTACIIDYCPPFHVPSVCPRVSTLRGLRMLASGAVQTLRQCFLGGGGYWRSGKMCPGNECPAVSQNNG